MKIAIIGAGNLGISIANGILNSELTINSLYLTKRNISELKQWKSVSNVIVTKNNVEAVSNSEIIILAVQPKQLPLVLGEIKDVINATKHMVISVITGRKISDIESVLGSEVPIIRSMPNTAISVSESMTCLCANKKGEDKFIIAQNIFNSVGKTMCIDEKLMQAATVICASGIAFWMRLIRATTQGAIQLGFDAKEAQELSMQTCLGAASLLVKSKSHPEQEIDRVTTPSGCTIEGLNEMEHQGLSSSLIKGLVASFEKINQI
ncbi:pyrroline-5-carboxylate reductase [Lutibacter sp. B1]|uniref:pyrroline-5-carboxylate reductase n=1 Tax=Lutibacter sp. B1 TaxID=2725996 RepID=UPI001456FFA5|nr:pyrroline-5-carboxylate reductase [Lutibacter sp. B1]NLP57389.1 pyrroline-5-carboxylate reductase [Lutibacter sp. B1]